MKDQAMLSKLQALEPQMSESERSNLGKYLNQVKWSVKYLLITPDQSNIEIYFC